MALKNHAVTLLVVLFTAIAAHAEPMALAGGRVRFTPPPGFVKWTTAQIARKFPAGSNAPEHFWAKDKRGITSVAVTFSPLPVTPEELPALMEGLERLLPGSLPGMKWAAREFVTLNGTRWAHLALTCPAGDTTLYNDIYLTSFDGKMLGISFNSTLAWRNEALLLFAPSRASLVVR